MNSILKVASQLAVKQIRDRLLFTVPIASNRFTNINKRWAHNAPLTYDFARERIMMILHLYDKIDSKKLTLDSHFVNDLGLDSLDHTDIIMEMEDEFNFEIPDKDAEKLLRPSDILRYITDKEEAYKELQDLEIQDHHNHHHHHHHEHNQESSHDNTTHQVSSSGSQQHKDLSQQKRGFSSWSITSRRYFADFGGLDDGEKKIYRTSFNEDPPKAVKIEDIQERVMKVLSKYDKIDSAQLQLASHFVDDLGLDSLDHVEIMMELEDEFGLEIPDVDAEKLMRPAEIARYIFKKEEARALIPEDRQL